MNSRYGALFWVLVLVTVSFTRCSPVTRYRILSTVFDGVPLPEELQPIVTDTTAVSDSTFILRQTYRVRAATFVHEVYRERNCEECHVPDGANSLVMPQPMLCYKCHEDFSNRYQVLHGPVASGFCTQCHSPHRSEFASLVLRPGQQLCLYCHEAASVFQNVEHEDLGDDSCTDCHSPHGGDDRFLF